MCKKGERERERDVEVVVLEPDPDQQLMSCHPQWMREATVV